MAIRVFLVDDHEVVRAAVRQLLESEQDIEVVGESGTAADALARIPSARADVAVLDARLPDGDGVSVCRELRSVMDHPPGCVLLTSYPDDEAMGAAIMAGIAAYLLKEVRGNDLVAAVRRVAAGESLLDS